MNLKITSLVRDESFTPFDLFNNVATLGNDCARLTWQASRECATEAPCILDTEEKREAFREFVRDSGGWTRAEIDGWDETELYTLFCQWVAGDIREAFGDASPDEWDWAEYGADCEAGRVSSRLSKDDAGDLFFYVGN